MTGRLEREKQVRMWMWESGDWDKWENQRASVGRIKISMAAKPGNAGN